MIKYSLAWLGARVFFWSGDFVSRIMNLNDYVGASLYPIYSWLMNISVQLDDWGTTNLWKPVDPATYE